MSENFQEILNRTSKLVREFEGQPPYTRGPWKTRAATFCADGTPSYEVVMPGGPQMNAVDARLISAAPQLYEALQVINTLACYTQENQDARDRMLPSIGETARAAISLIDVPTPEAA